MSDPRTIDRNDFVAPSPATPDPRQTCRHGWGHRSALEAGTDPAVVTGWIKQVEADRLNAERELASTASVVQPLSEVGIRALVAS